MVSGAKAHFGGNDQFVRYAGNGGVKMGADGAPSVARSDIFGGKVIPFVPLSGGHQSEG